MIAAEDRVASTATDREATTAEDVEATLAADGYMVGDLLAAADDHTTATAV
jgi:hypothetical protein